MLMYMHTCTHFTAVLFLEFWKRRQFKLQYDWDVLGYEAAEVGNVFIIVIVQSYTAKYHRFVAMGLHSTNAKLS